MRNKTLFIAIAAAAAFSSSAALADAHVEGSDRAEQSQDFPWGLLGLIGLAGLIGRKRTGD